ncbi:CPBP family intramembrane glutamic endopeptidase [Prochlorococcus sp. MIT 1223]|uniref:CPBP family intramembrane glutamic endopeptidase n=1 Tax=Prochlorococcus sp. MIT 1223 TaxID=3096217 RepID=UPI002A748386|nr:CPBP family intramembrane glutamic endopeptidase [Prochlorococcus sp. MIT 1223]
MRQVPSVWKLLAALLSLVLTVFVWQQGLKESLDRPSVAPKLSLRQQEMALVASWSPSIPESIKPVLVGLNPEESLKQLLQQIPLKELKDRDRLVLAALEKQEGKRLALLDFPLNVQAFAQFQKDLQNTSTFSSSLFLKEKDPFLFQIACHSLESDSAVCFDRKLSNSIALRLLGIQVFPIFATGLGVVLLLRQAWIAFRNNTPALPYLSEIPLSFVDMTLLIAGGFVVLGEIILPALIVPLVSSLSKGLSSPVNESLKVFIGYSAMTIPPLFILRQQIKGLKNLERPVDGWLQWRVFPLLKTFIPAINGWLMVMPFVLLTGWLMNVFVGDQGGSNPLLDLVLSSKNSLALFLLLITTVILAPVFEELIFRGALLPALAMKFGRYWGVIISALVFALAHLSVGELAPLFVLGIGLGVLRVKSGRLFSCAIMHSLWNGITFINLLLLR